MDGGWSDWKVTGECSVTCGGGTQIETRECNNPTPTGDGALCIGSDVGETNCNSQQCPGNYLYIIIHI